MIPGVRGVACVTNRTIPSEGWGVFRRKTEALGSDKIISCNGLAYLAVGSSPSGGLGAM